MNKKHVLVIVTGGTISMNKDMNNNKVTISNAHITLVDRLKIALPSYNIEMIEFFNKPSPMLKMGDLFTLAKLTNSSINSNKYDGIVITHGTDTLEETAFYLNQVLDNKKPVVVTGAMRSFSELGFDGMKNLLSSILVATFDESKNRGVLVVLNDEINSAFEVTKSNTLSLDTFKSLNFGPIGIIDDDRVIYYRETRKQPKSLDIVNIQKKVEIIKVYLDMDPFLINALIDNKVDGIILESLGRGNVPDSIVPAIDRALSLNIPVVLTSRCPMGRVLDTYDYLGGGAYLKKMGVIFASNYNSQKARIQLMLALSKTSNIEEIENMF